ncbi:uncharacterized protein LOC124438071 [Xenia sp. Carnegie-2017]|uniref:uncharacterized protein LOC124438071 n=1 Tax=Xenia sp. Carnegie-2017 TaxID=2897299 RepID=UPI001F04173B|nr:uncharacterized protein LOC124438071 [Xenia sp. Carnegie-2017]
MRTSKTAPDTGDAYLPETSAFGTYPFGFNTMIGSNNWFELLKSKNVFSVRRKSVKGSQKREYKRSITIGGDKPPYNVTGVKDDEKEENNNKIKRELSKPTANNTKLAIPTINIIRASDESLFELVIDDSSDDDDDDLDENEDLVYECPGLAASTGDMSVENPLFHEKQFANSYRTPEVPEKYWKDVFVESV